MRSQYGLKGEFQLILVYIVVFAIFASFAVASVVAMNYVIHYYTERETNVIATNLQLDLDAQLAAVDDGLADPEVRHLLEVYANLHDLDIVITDRKGIAEVSSVRDLMIGEPLFDQPSYFSPAQTYLMRDGTLHFIDGAWVSDGGVLNVTYCTTRPVIGTDSRMVILARNGRLMAELNRAATIFFSILGGLFIITLLLMTRILFGYRGRIIELATTDELTGIANRKSFLRRYSERGRKGIPEGAMLYMLDVDKFKGINDTYGHSAGDQALAFVAERIQSLMNQNCMAGRWGGDEFIGIYTGGRVSAGEKLALLLREIRETPIRLDSGKDMYITVSIGAVRIDTNLSLDKNIEQADAALYRSKAAGRDCLTIGENIGGEDRSEHR